jgi:hypothetical protein
MGPLQAQRASGFWHAATYLPVFFKVYRGRL